MKPHLFCATQLVLAFKGQILMSCIIAPRDSFLLPILISGGLALSMSITHPHAVIAKWILHAQLQCTSEYQMGENYRLAIITHLLCIQRYMACYCNKSGSGLDELCFI